MPLQTSGIISMSDIADEFNDSTPNSISEFYGAGISLPSSGIIRFSDFYGESNITGGTIYDDGTYLWHTFTSSGTFNTNGANISSLDYLIVGGGGSGGGGTSLGGGGGAGGYLSGTLSNQSGSFTITVGAGGVVNNAVHRDGGQGGGNSTGFGLTAYGGGRGGGDDRSGGSGGSGGGGCDSGAGGGSGVSGQGYSGGGGYGDGGGGAGGGGAAGAGKPQGPGVSNSYHYGGPPKQWIDGNYYAEGGHGGVYGSNHQHTTSYGISGAGGTNNGVTPRHAVANTGSGGGGGLNYWNGMGSNGGSGIVKIRYLKSAVS